MGVAVPELEEVLTSKPLYYKEIDHERIHRAYGVLKPHIRRPRTIHIVGTNGKGSTGRVMAFLAWRGGLSVGHYSSPHILRFNERIWLDGEDASNEMLERAHGRLYGILGKKIVDELSYFEYTTLLAFVVFEKCDLMVLEAGLGGEYDATNVCDKELSVITPIDIDHQAFLGDTIEEIAATKIRSIQKLALLSPQPHPEVLKVAKEIAQEKGAELVFAQELKKNETRENTHKRHQYELANIAIQKAWPEYLLQNSAVAMEALDLLGISYDPNDVKDLELFGRFYPIAPNIHIDVGHNPLAAKAIVKAMEPDTILIYNSLDDKDYETVLQTLKPKLKRVEIIKIKTQRAATLQAIEDVLKRLNIEYGYFDGKTDKNEKYLVFGSFYVVEEFLLNRELGIRN